MIWTEVGGRRFEVARRGGELSAGLRVRENCGEARMLQLRDELAHRNQATRRNKSVLDRAEAALRAPKTS